MSSQQQQQQQVKQPCQPPTVKCQETNAPKIKDACAPQAKKQCPPKGTVIPAQQKSPSAQQAPKNKPK
ncbi:small proline-rich protein 4 [Talpa occidentalis]|uniref:small proline-rich protein 4 n=1 Tax=Talpa occidentalis TaxID=50954 RepID=UPI00188F0F02|nr:small proline-rich protein 4 [Talpa occidentalis]